MPLSFLDLVKALEENYLQKKLFRDQCYFLGEDYFFDSYTSTKDYSKPINELKTENNSETK